MSESYQEFDETPVTREANYAQQEYIPAEPEKPRPEGVDEDTKDAEVLDFTQDIRRSLMENLRDGKGGMHTDPQLMALAIATARDMDAQALKKRSQRQKADADRANGNVAMQVMEIAKRLIENGTRVNLSGPALSSQPVHRDLSGDALPKPARVLNGEFSDGVAESSAEFFKRMEAE